MFTRPDNTYNDIREKSLMQWLADQIQLPRVDGKELYDIFFQMRLDHPEIFWVVGFSWKYYPDSPNLIFVPE